MKGISFILTVCIVISSLSGVLIVSAEENIEYLLQSPTESLLNFDFDTMRKGSSENPVVNCLQYSSIDEQATKYKQPAFFKFDISSLAGKNVKSAQLVWKSSNYKDTAIFDVPGNNITLDNANPSRIPIGSKIVSYAVGDGGPLDQTVYPGVPSTYNIKFSLTNYIKNKLAAGESEATVMWITNWGGEAIYDKNLAKLWVKVDNNVAPEIDLGLENGKYVKPDTALNFSATITDIDGEIASATLLFDGAAQPLTANGDVYSAAIPASLVTYGVHTVKITATDNSGAEVSVERTVYAEDENVRYKVISASEQIINKDFSTGRPTVVGDSITLNVIQSDSQTEKYMQPAFFKFQITEMADYDLENIQLVWGGTNYKPYNIYEVPENDLTLTYYDKNGTQVPNRIKVGNLITSKEYASNSPALKGYPGVPADYNMNFNLKSYVQEKLNAGETSFSVMVFAGWGGTANMNKGGAKLWFKYANNRKPTIDIKAPLSSAVVPKQDLLLSADVVDNDGTLDSVVFEYDGKVVTVSADGDNYSTVIPAANVTDGEHTLKITAIDDYGAVKTAEKTFYAVSYRVNSKAFTNGSGGAAVLAAGAVVEIKANIASTVAGGLDATVIIALYDKNNTMKACGFGKKTIESGGMEDVSASLTVPDNIDLATTTVKAYVTNGFRNMIILDDAAKLQ